MFPRCAAHRFLFVLLILLTTLVDGRQAVAEPPRLCAAIRGNGARIFVHFSSLAHFHELYGPLWGISGGSSGSVTSFLVDSIYANPFVRNCGEDVCRPEEKAARIALLLKTLQDHIDTLSAYPEAHIFFTPAVLAKVLEDQDVISLLEKSPAEGLKAFRSIVASERFRLLVNPEIAAALDQATDPVPLARDIAMAISGALRFEIDSSKIFLRPGATSFKVFADFYGRLASFYAAEGDFADGARMESFMQACATPGRGIAWPTLAKVKAGTSTCGDLYRTLLNNYYATAKSRGEPSRAELAIGSKSDLHVLVSVTQMTGASVVSWKRARRSYLAGTPGEWVPEFQDWTIAYMGKDVDLNRLVENRNKYADLKSQRVRVLKAMTWRDILEHSPAEPGMSRALEIAGGTVTTGGWADGQPVLALKNIGCDRVILFDKGPDQHFGRKVSELLGASPQDRERLFSVADNGSSLAVSYSSADAVWCANWEDGQDRDLVAMSLLGWNADIEVRRPDLMPPSQASSNARLGHNITACTAPFTPQK